MTADFTATDHGTLWHFTCHSEEAQQWARDHVNIEDWAGTAESFYADHRPAREILFGMLDAGLKTGGVE